MISLKKIFSGTIILVLFPWVHAQTLQKQFSGNNSAAYPQYDTNIKFTFCKDGTYVYETFTTYDHFPYGRIYNFAHTGWYTLTHDTIELVTQRDRDISQNNSRWLFLYDSLENRIIDLKLLVDYTNDGQSRVNKKKTILETDSTGNILTKTILYIPLDRPGKKALLSLDLCIRHHLFSLAYYLGYVPWTYQENFIFPGTITGYDEQNRLITYCPDCGPEWVIRSQVPVIFYITYLENTSYVNKIAVGDMGGNYYQFVYDKDNSIVRIDHYDDWGRLVEITRVE